MTHPSCILSLLLFVLAIIPLPAEYVYESIKINVDNKLNALEIKESFGSVYPLEEEVLCEATYGKAKEVGDWNMLWINVGKKVGEIDFEALDRLYYCFGFAEGALTYEEINHYFTNIYSDWFTDFARSPYSRPIYKFLSDNYAFMLEMSVKHRMDDNYWARVNRVLSQLKGMYAGYLYSQRKNGRLFSLPISFEDFLFINADGDLQTLIYAYQEHENHEKEFPEDSGVRQLSFESQREERCSVLIKPVNIDGQLDVLVGHTTWDHFETMGPRILKTANFGKLVHHSYTMSSSPGMLSSVDDFFITGSELVVTETTNEVFNKTLFLKVVPESLLSWVRARVSNLESTPEKWASTFAKYNSGTYNNQWMVLSAQQVLDDLTVDFNEESSGFLVLEQLPDFIRYEFKLDVIKEQGYWASYNIPYFADIWNLANYSLQEPADEFDHDKCPRAKIFKRQLVDNAEVNNLELFKSLMRYNNYTTDDLSKGNACNGISSRCDLNDVSSPTYKASGGMDCKIVSLRAVSRGFAEVYFTAQIGPTNLGVPSFNWTTLENRLHEANLDVPTHVGQAEVYEFDWVEFPTKVPDRTMLSEAIDLSRAAEE